MTHERLALDAATATGSGFGAMMPVEPAGANPLAALNESEPQSIARLLHTAVEKGVPVETLEKLVDLHERVSRRAAEQEFADAMARFQAECPSIPKTSTAKVTSRRTGTQFDYTYAELDQIAETVGPKLHQHGLSYGWTTKMEGKTIIVTCTLRHRNGHSATADFPCPTETESAMSAQQSYGAALTYARRQSLIQVLGLTTTDPDSDAATVDPATLERLTAEQAASLTALIEDAKADKARFLKWLGAESVESVRQADFKRAVAWLEAKRKAG